MTLTITIEMDNAAFEPCSGAEAARILRDLAGKFNNENLTPDDQRNLFDINGNPVGTADITD